MDESEIKHKFSVAVSVPATEVTQECESEGDEEYDEIANPDEELIPSEFVECIIRIADRKYPKVEGISERVVMLFENSILRYGCRTDKFREELAAPQIRKVFEDFRSPLQKIFIYYAKLALKRKKIKLPKGAKPQNMGMEDFVAMIKDIKLTSVVPSDVCVSIFKNIQHSDDADLDDDDELVYEEFLEGLAVVAFYYNPDPYIRLEHRISGFLKSGLIQNMGGTIKGLGKR
eukprot:798001_1